MAPQRFKIGQKVVCVRPNMPYYCPLNGVVCEGPNYNEIVTVVAFHTHRFDGNIPRIQLAEYRADTWYQESQFEPLLSDKALTELLEESLQHQTI